jgi:hypothetical protein
MNPLMMSNLDSFSGQGYDVIGDIHGYLTAYRWCGERELLPDHLVHVTASL